MSNESNYLTGPQVQARYNISSMTFWRWMKDEEMKFPRPVVIRRRNYFREDEIVAWERNRAANREVAA
jgi:predicted DNA-binding transcriptional regulator AlpA